MIKGVSRYAVEIDKTDSPFFEKVICFVRPQYADGNSINLHREAVRVVNNLNSGVEEAQSGSRHVIRAGDRPNPGQNGGAGDRPKFDQNGVTAGGLPANRWVPMLLSAGGGAAAAFIISALI